MDELTSRQIMGLTTLMGGLVSLILLLFWSLVMRAKSAEAQAHQDRLYARGILDSIPSQIAVLDRQGVIIDVNQAWRKFAIDNSSRPGVPSPNTDVGTNYLDVCGHGDLADPQDTGPVSNNIRAVLDGRLPTFSVEYPCHSPSEKRWFMMTVTPLQPGQVGAVVTHYNITDRKMMELKIHHLAFFDGLTQLPNRRLFNDRLGHALAASKRSGNHGALVMLDLDNFKSLNDQHGHAAGDLLLMEVAKRLQSHVREEDTVARLGGDEFILIMEKLDPNLDKARSQVMAIAQKVQSSLEQAYQLTQERSDKDRFSVDHHCTSSIGVTLFVGHQDPDVLLFRVDKAMYQAKATGKNRIEFA